MFITNNTPLLLSSWVIDSLFIYSNFFYSLMQAINCYNNNLFLDTLLWQEKENTLLLQDKVPVVGKNLVVQYLEVDVVDLSRQENGRRL